MIFLNHVKWKQRSSWVALFAQAVLVLLVSIHNHSPFFHSPFFSDSHSSHYTAQITLSEKIGIRESSQHCLLCDVIQLSRCGIPIFVQTLLPLSLEDFIWIYQTGFPSSIYGSRYFSRAPPSSFLF